MEQPLQCTQETEPVRKRRRKRRRRCKQHPKDGPHSPNCRGDQNAVNSKLILNGNKLVRILPTLKPILDYLNVNGEIFTREQIMGHLTEYIRQKALFDPADPRKVYCENDQLGEIFGCNEFSTANACELLLRNLQTIDNPPIDPQESQCRLPAQACCSSSGSHTNTLTLVSTTDTCSCSESDQQPSSEPCSSRHMTTSVMASSSLTTMSMNRIGMKRNHDNACSDSSQLAVYEGQETFSRVELTAGCSRSDWQLPSDHEPTLRKYTRHYKYCENNVTDVVTDTSDDLFFLYETDEAPAPAVDTDEDTFAEEYEPISYSDEEQLLALNRQYADADKIDSFDTEVDEGEDGGDELGNDDGDSEIEEEDKWQCESCSERNHPMTRHCRKCWTVREDWYPTLSRSISDPVSLRNKTPHADPASVSDSVSTSLIRQQSNYSYMGSKCVICTEEPPNGCIVHGQTGHQVTCVGCAKKLKNEGKGCPVCHKKIRLVIKNFL